MWECPLEAASEEVLVASHPASPWLVAAVSGSSQGSCSQSLGGFGIIPEGISEVPTKGFDIQSLPATALGFSLLECARNNNFLG